ncbi:MAG: diadenylate cyclase CdaA [Peptostreptococcales bacterium]
MPNVLNIFSQIRVMDVIDIIIVALVVYKVLHFIRETRASQLVKGLILLLIVTNLSELLRLNTIYWLLRNTMTLGSIAIIIVFQPELRRALEYLGRGKFWTRSFLEIRQELVKDLISNLVSALSYLSKNNIGALIILERETSISDFTETGTILNADVSEQLLINIFNTNAPLHDGAVIIRGESIFAAGCVLPLSENKSLSKELGTRHRAGIGITERSDAVSLIVSEETGAISIAIDGKLSRFLDIQSVERILNNLYLNDKKHPLLPFVKKIWSPKR